MKENSCSHKLRYRRYLELIYKRLSNDMNIELTRMRIPYEKITYVYKKSSYNGCVSDL
jgi:hypothetical protein